MSDISLLEPDPSREEAMKALRTARVCKMRKDNWGAFVEAERACRLAPRSVEAHELASDYGRDVLQWEGAVAHLEAADSLDPGNADRAARLEKLRKDAAVYSRSVTELVSEAREGGESWLAVCKSVFLRPDPVWYRAGWFHQALAWAGVLLLLFLVRWLIATGPWFFLFLLAHLAMVAWVAYDSHVHGEPALFWGPVALVGSLFGFALYLAVRGMSSGIGHQGGGRFFSG